MTAGRIIAFIVHRAAATS